MDLQATEYHGLPARIEPRGRRGEDPVSQHLPEEPTLLTPSGPRASRTERESVPLSLSPPFLVLGRGSPGKLRHQPTTEENVSFPRAFQESGAQWPCASESLAPRCSCSGVTRGWQ